MANDLATIWSKSDNKEALTGVSLLGMPVHGSTGQSPKWVPRPFVHPTMPAAMAGMA